MSLDRSLSSDQLDNLDRLQGDIGAAVDQLLQERGLALKVHSIQLVALPPTSVAGEEPPIVAEPEPSKMPPPGGVYTCWQEKVGGPWICVCGTT